MIINEIKIFPYVPNVLTTKNLFLEYIQTDFRTNGISYAEWEQVNDVAKSIVSLKGSQMIGNINISITSNLDDYPTVKISCTSSEILPNTKDLSIVIPIGGEPTTFIVDKYSYTINQKRIFNNTLEFKSLNEQILEQERELYPTSLSGKISINTLLNQYGLMLNGPDNMIKISEGGEKTTLREKIDDSLKNTVSIVSFSNNINVTKFKEALNKLKQVETLDIISDISMEDMPHSFVNLDPVIITYDADKNGFEDVDTLGEVPKLKELLYEESTLIYGDINPELPPDNIKTLNNLTSNWDVSGETKVKVIETYQGTRLIQKNTQTYGFAYNTIDISKKNLKTGVYTLNGSPSSYWQIVGQEITTYEYLENFYTGSLTTGWRLERFEIEYLKQNKLPATIDLWEQKANTNPSDVDGLNKINNELEKYNFIKIPFSQYEKLTLEPLYYYYKDIDTTNSIVQFNGKNNTILYAINPIISPEYFVTKYDRGKYGIEVKENDGEEGDKFSYLSFTGTEEREIEIIKILESVNTYKNAKATTPASKNVTYIEYEYPISSASTAIINSNVPKEDKYTTYKYFFSSQHGDGLYSHIRRASNNVTFGRPGSVSSSNPEKEFYLQTQGFDDDYYEYKSKVFIGFVSSSTSSYAVKSLLTFGEINNAVSSNILVYYPIIYLNQLPTTKLFFNVTTENDVKGELENYYIKEYVYQRQEKITFTALTPNFYSNGISAGTVISITSLGIKALVETAEYNYTCIGSGQRNYKGFVSSNPAWTGTVSITAMIIPIDEVEKLKVDITSINATDLIKSKITIPLVANKNKPISSKITPPKIYRRGSS
jgi:hypothetical protein